MGIFLLEKIFKTDKKCNRFSSFADNEWVRDDNESVLSKTNTLYQVVQGAKVKKDPIQKGDLTFLWRKLRS